jgi:hypothetical protein
MYSYPHFPTQVMLSAEGKEYEFANGRRIEGDNGCGILIQVP